VIILPGQRLQAAWARATWWGGRTGDTQRQLAICHRPFGFSCSNSLEPNSPTERKGTTELARWSTTPRPLHLFSGMFSQS